MGHILRPSFLQHRRTTAREYDLDTCIGIVHVLDIQVLISPITSSVSVDQLVVMKCRATLDDRVAEVLTWFDGDPKDFPVLGLLHLEEPDGLGHLVGPLDSRVGNTCYCDALMWFMFSVGSSLLEYTNYII